MSTLHGRRIILGITGSIAAYKAVDLLRQLQQQGADVQVVMTEATHRFITEDTLRTLSGKPVLTDMFAEPLHWKVEHVALADWAELVVIAPATATTMARLAHGMADNLLCCLALSTRAPILIVPAMDEGMLTHQATQENISRLRSLGYAMMGTEAGALASGKVEKGRMVAAEQILAEAERLLSPQDLTGLRFVITAGPTREVIDPVRCITNASSGKMGYALAEAAQRRGAQVILVSGPTHLPSPHGVESVIIESAAQMLEATLEHAAGADVCIGAAAPGDFTPKGVSSEKLKRFGELTLELTPTKDIIAAVAGLGKKRPTMVVGFAAEAKNLIESAKEKLARKGIDLIVANDITQPGGVFGTDENQASLIYADGTVCTLQRMSKCELANEILTAIKKGIEARD